MQLIKYMMTKNVLCCQSVPKKKKKKKLYKLNYTQNKNIFYMLSKFNCRNFFFNFLFLILIQYLK